MIFPLAMFSVSVFIKKSSSHEIYFNYDELSCFLNKKYCNYKFVFGAKCYKSLLLELKEIEGINFGR